VHPLAVVEYRIERVQAAEGGGAVTEKSTEAAAEAAAEGEGRGGEAGAGAAGEQGEGGEEEGEAGAAKEKGSYIAVVEGVRPRCSGCRGGEAYRWRRSNKQGALRAGALYRFRVTARNRCGWGEPSSWSNAVGLLDTSRLELEQRWCNGPELTRPELLRFAAHQEGARHRERSERSERGATSLHAVMGGAGSALEPGACGRGVDGRLRRHGLALPISVLWTIFSFLRCVRRLSGGSLTAL
jgi:hypothetical protein